MVRDGPQCLIELQIKPGSHLRRRRSTYTPGGTVIVDALLSRGLHLGRVARCARVSQRRNECTDRPGAARATFSIRLWSTRDREMRGNQFRPYVSPSAREQPIVTRRVRGGFAGRKPWVVMANGPSGWRSSTWTTDLIGAGSDLPCSPRLHPPGRPHPSPRRKWQPFGRHPSNWVGNAESAAVRLVRHANRPTNRRWQVHHSWAARSTGGSP
jgi:hypothetical protein